MITVRSAVFDTSVDQNTADTLDTQSMRVDIREPASIIPRTDLTKTEISFTE